MIITKVPIIQIIKNGETIEVNPLTSVNDIGISSGTLKLDTSIVKNELSFGELISSQLSVQLFNIDDNLEGCSIQLLLEKNGVRSSKFKGIIDSSKRDNIGGYRDIIAYDWIYYNRDYDISNWWNNFWVNTRTSATIQEIRQSLITYLGFTNDSKTYVNDSIVIPNNFNFYTDLKLNTILKMICELQATFPHIDENGNMEFISITNTNTSDLTGLYEGNNSKWEDYTTDLITGVGIYSTSNDLSQLIGTAVNVYNISGNLFALTLDAQTLNTLGNNILNAISSIQFTPSKIKMITTNFDLVLGQRVSTPKGYGYVMTNSLSGVCLIEQTIESKSMGSKLSQRVNSKNDTLIEGARMSKFEQTIDGFNLEVQRIDQVATEAQETADGLADDVQTANNNASTALSTANNANTTAITAQSQVTQMADQIVLKVDNNGNVVKVALSSDASTGSNVLIKGDNIQLDGNVTITSGFRLTAGVIQSANYVAQSTGMKIDLSTGQIIFNDVGSILLNSKANPEGIISQIGVYNAGGSRSTRSMMYSYGIEVEELWFGDTVKITPGVITVTNNNVIDGTPDQTVIKQDSINANWLTANKILVSDSNKNIVSSGYEFDINTKNTSDTWLLVMKDSKIQHRISTDLSVNYATGAGRLNNAGTNPTYSTPASWGSASGDGAKLYWFNATGKIANQPAQYGFLLHLGLSYGEGHQIWATQANGDLYHRGFNSGGNLSSLQFKKILDTSNGIASLSQSGSIYAGRSLGVYASSETMIAGTDKGNRIWSCSSGSDQRIKTNIKPSTINALNIINQIPMRSFDYTDKKYGTHSEIGYVAQEVMNIMPDIVFQVPLDSEEEKAKYGTDWLYQIEDKPIIPYLVKAIQELSDKIMSLENKLKTEE